MKNAFPKPLEGKTVVDFTSYLPGPYCTSILAAFGAKVIKVEPPKGDPTRVFNNTLFEDINCNKYSVVIDLKTEEGRKHAKNLVLSADAMIESFRPGTMARNGLDQQALREENPKLVYCAISGFGQFGPYQNHPTHDMSCLAIAGYFSVPSQLDHKPGRPQVRLADLAAGQTAANTVAMAIWEAEKTGKGSFVDISMFDSVAHWATQMILATPDIDTAPVAAMPWIMADSDIYKTKDGRYISLATLEDKFWVTAAEVLAKVDPRVADTKYADRKGRNSNKQELHALLTETFARLDFEEWKRRFENTETCWGPVYERAELLSDPHYVARGILGNNRSGGEQGSEGKCTLYPAVVNGSRNEIFKSAPELGAETNSILNAEKG